MEYVKIKFIEKCLLGLEKIENIDNYIDEWHEYINNDEELYDFLGMKLNEFENYLKNNDSISNIIDDRKKSLEILKKNLETAERFVFLDGMGDYALMNSEIELVMQHNEELKKIQTYF
jgi:hypothetical protein